MNDEITLEKDGVVYSAEYTVIDEKLTVYLPDGSSTSAVLNGLKPESTAESHLRGYIRQLGLAFSKKDKMKIN